MGRRPIIIPRHQSQVSKQRGNRNARELDSLAQADCLAHPLAFAQQNEQLENEERLNNSFGSSGSGSGSVCGGIGIRRHGHHNQFSTPEKKKRTRMVRKRSPTSILLPLEFIQEEGEEEQEELLLLQPHQQFSDSNQFGRDNKSGSVISDSALLSGTREDDEERLSDILGNSFGSVIEHVDESHDFGHNLVIPEVTGFAPENSGSDEDRSTGTFGEMMLQQEHEMRYHQERERMAEDHMTSLLSKSVSVGSSIISTSTLERSLEYKKRQFFKEESYKRPPSTFQRLLKTATLCRESRNEVKSYNAMIQRKNSALSNTDRMPTPSVLLPEEQRRAALARYRYNQIIHNKNITTDEPPIVIRKSNTKVKSRSCLPAKEENDPRVSFDSPEDSFASIDDELLNLRDYTLRSNASFRQAESCLSNDLNESSALVKTLEEQLLAAREQRELCLERYELAKDKRQKEKELTAIRTLHLEILNCSGRNERSRIMMLERHKHEMASGRETGILEIVLSRKQHSQKPQVDPLASAEKENSFGGSSQILNDSNGIFEDPYVHKSIDELRVIKNRLEAIKDLFDKARYMVSEELSSSSSQSDRLRKEHQAQVMIETAASKYILFRSKKLI